MRVDIRMLSNMSSPVARTFVAGVALLGLMATATAVLLLWLIVTRPVALAEVLNAW